MELSLMAACTHVVGVNAACLFACARSACHGRRRRKRRGDSCSWRPATRHVRIVMLLSMKLLYDTIYRCCHANALVLTPVARSSPLHAGHCICMHNALMHILRIHPRVRMIHTFHVCVPRTWHEAIFHEIYKQIDWTGTRYVTGDLFFSNQLGNSSLQLNKQIDWTNFS